MYEEGNTIRIAKPYFAGLSLQDLNEMLQEQIKEFDYKLIACVGGMIFLGGALYYSILSKVSNATKHSRPINDNEIDSKICILCYEKVKNVIFRPCGHLCICYDCNLSYNKKVCLMCRKNIEEEVVLHLKH